MALREVMEDITKNITVSTKQVVISGKKLNISVPKNSKTAHSIFCTTGSPWLITNFTSENEVFGVGLLLKKTPLK